MGCCAVQKWGEAEEFSVSSLNSAGRLNVSDFMEN